MPAPSDPIKWTRRAVVNDLAGAISFGGQAVAVVERLAGGIRVSTGRKIERGY
jgi:hypothetical protein